MEKLSTISATLIPICFTFCSFAHKVVSKWG